MADTTFVSKVTTITTAWLQALNDFIYRGKNPNYVTSTGAANAYTITIPPTSLLAALTAGNEFTFKANFANTGPATLTIVGSVSMGPYAIQQSAAALTGGEIQNMAIVKVVFDGTACQLIGAGGITLPVPIAQGGTNAITAAAARTTLGAAGLADNNVFTGSNSFALLLGLTAGQLQFPATQNPSANPNVLDDYAEGTWTPTLGGTATYSVQLGYFIKIGRLVYFYCQLNISSLGTGSNTTISGLPYSVSNNGIVSIPSWNLIATSVYWLTAFLQATSIVIQGTTGLSTNPSNITAFGANTSITVVGLYHTTN